MIKGLQKQLNPGGLIKIGKKGAMVKSANGVEFRPPKKLDHFQLVTTEKDANGDYIVDVDLQNKIKASGNGLVNKNGCLVGLPIRLLYNDLELNFPHRYVSYVSGKLSCHGDGETSYKRIDSFQVKHTCPCPRVESGYDGNDKCKPSGALTCIIDEAGLFGQTHTFRTTSLNTIKGIIGGIDLISMATGGRIAGLPLMLTMNAKQTTTPQGINTTVYVVSICYRGGMADLRDEALRIMSTEKQYLLTMDSMEAAAKESAAVLVVNPDDERDYVEEFFPEAAVKEINGEVETVDTQAPEAPETPEETKTESGQVGTETEELQGLLRPVGQYKKIYDQFVAEKDLFRAVAIAKRLQKGNLLYWLANTYPDIDFEPNIKKPEALELITNVLESVLRPASSGHTEQAHVQLEEAKEQEPFTPYTDHAPEPQPEPEQNQNSGSTDPRSWDDSGPIQKDQLRELVRLKEILQKQGTLKPDKWVDHVKYFLDANGQPIEKATLLTTVQGEHFIDMLEAHVKEEQAA